MRIDIAMLTYGIALAVLAMGPVYKCADGKGGTIFADQPCAADATTVNIPNGVAQPKPGKDPTWCDEGPAPEELVSACLEMWRSALRDPAGAYARGGQLARNEKNGNLDVFVDGYAKNGFGGTNPIEMQCQRTAENKIDADGTLQWIKLFHAANTLDLKLGAHNPRACK